MQARDARLAIELHFAEVAKFGGWGEKPASPRPRLPWQRTQVDSRWQLRQVSPLRRAA